jgi:hypothetical protein
VESYDIIDAVFGVALVCGSSEGRLLDSQRHCIVDFDMFHHLVSLCLSLPALYAEDESAKKKLHVATGGLNDLHALRLVLVAHIVQILTTASSCLSDDGKLATSVIVMSRINSMSNMDFS